MRSDFMSDIQSMPVTQVAPPTGGEKSEREFTVKERRQWQIVLSRFLRHRLAVASLIVFLLLVLLAYVVPLFWPHSYKEFNSPSNVRFSPSNPMGTDSLGH